MKLWNIGEPGTVPTAGIVWRTTTLPLSCIQSVPYVGANSMTKRRNPLGARKQDEWETPKYIFDWATQGYSINLDVCASAKNYKASPYISKKQDGLKESWAGYRYRM